MSRYQQSRQGTGYQPVCKVCGARRWNGCTHALCEKHFLEYMRINGRACYRRKLAKMSRQAKAS